MKSGSPKRIIRNVLILCLDALLRSRGNKKGKRIIALHEVKSASKLREKLLWLKEQYDLVSLADLFHQSLGEKTMLAITFDDGYACWHEHAAPILVELGIPAVFFVCSGFIDVKEKVASRFCRNQLRRGQNLLPLSKEQLKDLAEHALFEIGSHTKNHLDLGQIHDEILLEEEVIGDRKQLQDWTGKDIRWFAYPFGGFDNVSSRAKEYVIRASFDAAFTLVPKFLDNSEDKWMLGRDSLDVEDSTWLWQAWLNGCYDRLYLLKS
jgi:peptidoglycan/xylan/chitin deacetylase (PgdA/CDA1 family)